MRWTAGDEYVISVGGADTAVMLWKHRTASSTGGSCGDSDDSDTDSEEEGGKFTQTALRILNIVRK